MKYCLLFAIVVYVQLVRSEHFEFYLRRKLEECKKKCANKDSYDPNWLGFEKNCQNFCLSEECYNQVFSANPLKPDQTRISDVINFKDCTKKEAKEKGINIEPWNQLGRKVKPKEQKDNQNNYGNDLKIIEQKSGEKEHSEI